MKRTLALILSLVLVVGLFSMASAESKTKITWMSWGHSRPQEIRNEALAAAFPELAAKYEIEPIVGGQSVPDVADKMRMLLASNGNLPDIFQINSMMFMEFAAAGVCEDLSSLYAQYDEKLLPGMKDLVTFEGKQYAFPYCVNTLMWFYRSDMMKEAGIDMAAIQNVDDMIIAGQKLKEKFPDSSLLDLSPNTLATLFQWLMNGSGYSYYNKNASKYNMAENETVRAILSDLKRLQDSGIGANIDTWTPDWEQGFGKNIIASSLICNWFKDAAFLPNYAPDTKGQWETRVWPSIGGVTEGSENGGAMIIVLKDGEHKAEAIELLTKLCFTNEGNLAMFRASAGSLTPLLMEAYNADEVAAGDAFFGQAVWAVEQDSMKVYQTMDFNPASSLESTIVTNYAQKFFMGELQLDDTLKGMDADLTSQIGNPYGY